MKAKEYLHQAYRLDKRIQSNIEEMERLRELSTSVSSPVGEREYKPSGILMLCLSDTWNALKNYKSRLMMR